MAAGGHFGCAKFDRSSGPFISIRYYYIFLLFDKIATVGHFGCPKSLSIAFLDISDRYGTFYIFEMFDKMAVLDVRKSLSIAFLDISDRYGTLFYRQPFWMSQITFDHISGHFRSIGHFGCLKITFHRISEHFISIRNLLVSAYSFGHGEAYMLYINILISWWRYGSTHVSCIIRTKFNFNIRSPTHKPPNNTTSNVMITFVQNMK